MTEMLGKSTEDLAIRLHEIQEHSDQPYLTEDRKKQLRLEMGRISFELNERAKEQ